LVVTQPGSAVYAPATQKTVEFDVSKLYQTIYVNAPGQAFVGSDYDVTATSTSGLPVDLSTSDSGSNTTICTISASGAGNWTVSMLAGALSV
jgi:hypothetical protein